MCTAFYMLRSVRNPWNITLLTQKVKYFRSKMLCGYPFVHLLHRVSFLIFCPSVRSICSFLQDPPLSYYCIRFWNAVYIFTFFTRQYFKLKTYTQTSFCKNIDRCLREYLHLWNYRSLFDFSHGMITWDVLSLAIKKYYEIIYRVFIYLIGCQLQTAETFLFKIKCFIFYSVI